MRFVIGSWTDLDRITCYARQCLLCLLIAVAACASACATPTALNVIPTAEVLAHGSANFEVQLYGGPTSSGYSFINQFQTQLGVGGNVELGFDPSLGPNKGNYWNAKYGIYQETSRRPALAVGEFANIPGSSSPLYVTAFKSCGTSRLHAGSIYLGNALRCMLGWEIGHDHPLVFQADFISGPNTYTSIGVEINWRNGASLNVAQLIGNSSRAPNAYLVIVGWTGKVF